MSPFHAQPGCRLGLPAVIDLLIGSPRRVRRRLTQPPVAVRRGTRRFASARVGRVTDPESRDRPGA